ncbi:MAG: TIGR01906 family membrane protein [Dehalococcoidales bacterium]|nr:TIGR01906 family membrane protein [Dehalococcoidales bacterium]
MKAVLVITRSIFILCIPLLIFSAVIGIAFNSVALYEYGFNKYEVSSETGISGADLKAGAEELIHYFNSGNEFADISVYVDGVETQLYTREESLHMKDVKGLVRLDYLVLLVTFLYVLAYVGIWIGRKADRRKLARSILSGSLMTLVIMLALWLVSLWDFARVFYEFHELAFSNDFWSAEGYMLKMFPGRFWFDVTLFCTLGMATIAAISGICSGVYLYVTGKGLLFYRLMS